MVDVYLKGTFYLLYQMLNWRRYLRIDYNAQQWGVPRIAKNR